MTYRTQFEKELEDLKIDLIKMGDEVIANINDGLKSFLSMDGDLAQITIKKDKIVNEYEKIIEKKCLQIILKEQPVAKDLRLITSVLKMITDIERIGDHAADISKMTIFMHENTQPYHVSEMELMTEASKKMIKKALDSFVTKNLDLAYEVINDDDVVDAYFEQVKKTVASAIRKNEIDADYALYLMMVAKYLERIGDHAVNIGEWVIFSILGEHKEKVTP